MSKQVIVVGSGNAALCAGIAALEGGAQVPYDGAADLLPLLKDPDDPRLEKTDSEATQRPNSPMIC